ncbi:hypothetical protein L1787_23700 [Acuticoccus sp. M5D2P5]|uniref:hypothetical protein n=1 Tax=Acuticoccus kalidii TaxID=2910977 RepID=UPI001F3B290A|nr:hypothetical protein [Acuticoccus kalidii]MCF3936402.1 hypothetical protein [Acuticoccus kalidii]
MILQKKLYQAAIALLVLVSPVMAQDIRSRAEELKIWREQCSDSDGDLRQAYIEEALATNDVAIARICIRSSLESTDADIRNLGLRASLTAVDRLLFIVEPSAKLKDPLARSERERDALKDVTRTPEMKMWNAFEKGIVFVVDQADVTRGTSTWFPLVGLTEPHAGIKGEATIVGDNITWVGDVYSIGACIMPLRIAEGDAQLTGTIKCGTAEPFPVTAQLL